MHRPPQRHGDPIERRVTGSRRHVSHHRHRIRPNLPARNPRPTLRLVIAALPRTRDHRRHRALHRITQRRPPRGLERAQVPPSPNQPTSRIPPIHGLPIRVGGETVGGLTGTCATPGVPVAQTVVAPPALLRLIQQRQPPRILGREVLPPARRRQRTQDNTAQEKQGPRLTDPGPAALPARLLVAIASYVSA